MIVSNYKMPWYINNSGIDVQQVTQNLIDNPIREGVSFAARQYFIQKEIIFYGVVYLVSFEAIIVI